MFDPEKIPSYFSRFRRLSSQEKIRRPETFFSGDNEPTDSLCSSPTKRMRRKSSPDEVVYWRSSIVVSRQRKRLQEQQEQVDLQNVNEASVLGKSN